MSTLIGHSPLADDVYLVLRYDFIGHVQVATPTVTGLAVAGGLLCELVLGGHLEIESSDGALRPRHYGGRVGRCEHVEPPPLDALAHRVLDDLLAEAHPLRTWLSFLGLTAADDVVHRLARRGVVREVETRRLVRTRTTWQVTDEATKSFPVTRLINAFPGNGFVPSGDVVLAGLVWAAGLAPAVWHDRAGLAEEWIQYRLTDQLTDQHPGVRAVIEHVRAGVATSALI